MKHSYPLIALAAIALALPACDREEASPPPAPTADKPAMKDAHTEGGHEHAETPLGAFDIGGIKVEAAQGHGAVEPGKEGHLVIKLPYEDDGATVVRAWIGTADRTLSTVGRGEYAPSHDDYDIHAVAPSPLPPDAQWWVEIEKPDGGKTVGSFPLLKEASPAK